MLYNRCVVTWLAQASCRFLLGACHIPENERTDCLYDGKEERGKLNIFVASIWAPETSHNNKQQNQNRDSYIQTVSIADNWTLGN